ncbi:hypothetical protein PG985_009533 [Apiospora marii]|uniref:J domain-containing protein n=1 Tax=Apiospora marii TaxID=335849 RepID=A0ABR1RFV5_9PEZI
MAPEPTFDYYAELGIPETASALEIRTAYRQLALVRHPDRNPNDPTATASFQRIQEAYETLADANTKAIYDNARARAHHQTSPFDAGGAAAEDFSSFSYGQYTFTTFPTFGARPSHYFAREAYNRRREAFWRAQNEQFEQRMRAAEAERAAAEAQAEQDRIAAERRAQRERSEEERREAAARQAAAAKEKAEAEERRRAERREAIAREAADEALAREEGARIERAEQEARWTVFKAVTDVDKRSACLHSQYDGWFREVSQRKAKCEACGVKRSMSNFGCPYCGLLVCPKCRSELAEQKRDMEKNN